MKKTLIALIVLFLILSLEVKAVTLSVEESNNIIYDSIDVIEIPNKNLKDNQSNTTEIEEKKGINKNIHFYIIGAVVIIILGQDIMKRIFKYKATDDKVETE